MAIRSAAARVFRARDFIARFTMARSLAERFGISAAIPAMIFSTLAAMPEDSLFLCFSQGIFTLLALALCNPSSSFKPRSLAGWDESKQPMARYNYSEHKT